MTEDQIDKMVNKFLSWKLPQDFTPDGCIHFTPPIHDHHWPVGTNLLDARQAKDMIKHLLENV